jgi:hypothetical protein
MTDVAVRDLPITDRSLRDTVTLLEKLDQAGVVFRAARARAGSAFGRAGG